LAGRVRLGSITGIERDRLAPSRRSYAGGGGSVRGFGFQRLGPRINVPNPNFDPAEDDPEDVPPTLSLPVGGRSLTELAIEGRYRFGNYGVVAFIDGGSVSDEEYPASTTSAWASASAVASTPISARSDRHRHADRPARRRVADLAVRLNRAGFLDGERRGHWRSGAPLPSFR
jgi:outer membrane protein assembly factor BamA